jgi:hypothetical protein
LTVSGAAAVTTTTSALQRSCPAALAHAPRGTLLEHLLKVPEMREHHLAPAVEQHDVHVARAEQKIEGERRSDASATTCDHHLHRDEAYGKVRSVTICSHREPGWRSWRR